MRNEYAANRALARTVNKDADARVLRAANVARMATDTLAGLKRVDKALELYASGLVSADEAISIM